MKKRFSLLLAVLMMLTVLLPTTASAVVSSQDVDTPTDVPKILIYSEGNIAAYPYEYVASSVTVIDEEGGSYETVVDDAAKVKIRGNSTSSAYKKPYNIKFSSKQDLFGMGKAKKWSLLANCYDKTLIRNAIVMDIARELGVPYTPDYRYVDVYVNDEFMGSYLLIESVEVDENRVDIDVDNNEFLLELDYNPEDEDSYYFYSSILNNKFAINEPEKADLTQDQIDYVEDLVAKAEAALESGDFEEVQKYFDIESMASFYLLLEYFRNIDVATSSTRFHIKGGKIYGGPAWDFDLSAGNYNDDYYHTSDETSYKSLHAIYMKWFGQLVWYEDFQNIVNEKFTDNYALFQNIFEDNALGTNRIDTMIEKYGASFDRNHNEAGWTPDRVYHSSMQLERDPDPTYEANVEFYRGWLESRTEWLVKEWNIELPSAVNCTLDANYSETAPTVDGVVANGEYSSNPALTYSKDTIEFIQPDDHDDYNDWDFDFYLNWNEDALSMAWVVKSDVHAGLPMEDQNGDGVFDSYDYYYMWEYSCIQFIITPGAPEAGVTNYQSSDYSGNYLEMGFCDIEGGETATSFWSYPIGVDPDSEWFDQVEAIVVRDEDAKTTTYEISVPWFVCGIDAPEEDSSFGLSFAVAAQEHYTDVCPGMIEWNNALLSGKNADNAGVITLKGAEEPPVEPDILLGDVNQDGVIDMFDYLLVKSFYFEVAVPTADEALRADINEDDVIDMFDYLEVKTAYFNS